MPYQTPPRPERRLLYELWTLSRLLFNDTDKESGIAVLQRMMLRHVGRFPGTSPGTVAQELQLPPSVVAGTLVELERQRLVRRAPHPKDRRRAMLGLTARGRALLEADAVGVEERVRAVLDGCSTAERDAFEAIMKRLIASFDEAPAGATSRSGQGASPEPLTARSRTSRTDRW